MGIAAERGHRRRVHEGTIPLPGHAPRVPHPRPRERQASRGRGGGLRYRTEPNVPRREGRVHVGGGGNLSARGDVRSRPPRHRRGRIARASQLRRGVHPTARGRARELIMRTFGILGALVVATILASAGPAAGQTCQAPRVLVDTVLGMKYCTDPAFNGAVDALTQKLRQDARAARQAGRLVIYMSTPISPRGGGVEKVNVEIAAAVKARLEKAHGSGVWILDPGAHQMPNIGTKSPGGGDYMVMFTRLLAGDYGAGRDFDRVHFTGPSDMRAFFGCADDLSGCLARWLTARAATDADVRKVADT